MNAIRICLLKANGYLNRITYDYSQLVDPLTLELGNRLAKTFIPFENNELFIAIEKAYDIKSPDGLRNYFSTPIKCLLKIAGSIDFWEKEWGNSGYFEFLYKQIGRVIDFEDEKISFCVRVDKR